MKSQRERKGVGRRKKKDEERTTDTTVVGDRVKEDLELPGIRDGEQLAKDRERRSGRRDGPARSGISQ